MEFVFLSKGKLFYKLDSDEIKEFESKFIEDLRVKANRIKNSKGWKAGSGNSIFNENLWGDDEAIEEFLTYKITAFCKGENPDEIYYAVESERVGAILKYDFSKDEEQRVIHSNDLYVVDLYKGNDEKIYCSLREENGTASIACLEGGSMKYLTDGDSIDEAPCVLNEKEFLFQSSGIAFNGSGFRVGIGNSKIYKMDLESKEIEQVLGNKEFDFLLAKQNDAGEIYFIKRPYDFYNGHKGFSILNLLLDIILFPFRLIRTIFHFLDAMSVIFSKKPLSTAGMSRKIDNNPHVMFLRGRFINVDKLGKKYKSNEFSLVSEEWELMKKDKEGNYTVLAKDVASFDIDDSGKIVYTNGSDIFQIKNNGEIEKIGKDSLIENVYVL